MKPACRQQWVIDWLCARKAFGRDRWSVDVLNRDFVDEYVEATGATYQAMPYGANKCSTLGRDLGALFRQRRLKRHASGIGDGLCHQGFPRWVWIYYLESKT